MTVRQFVRAFSSAEYEVAMIGFAPGFPYLSGLPNALAQPRHPTPRLRVPAGSVAIAGGHAGVYPVESPGGWQLIGRTPARLFRPEAEEPFLLAPGDRVSFVPADAGPLREKPDTSESSDAPWEKSGDPGPPEAPHGTGSPGMSGGDEIVLRVIRAGFYTTVQDSGRNGWLAYGVSSGGAMDTASMRAANALVGNPETEAVLEMSVVGPVFRTERDLLAAVCGADMEARIDGETMPMNRPVWLRAGATVSFGRARRGCRAYLAVAGGIAVPPVLGSRSTDARAGIGGLAGRSLRAGDALPGGRLSPLGERLAAKLKRAAERERRVWASVRWAAGPQAGPAGGRRGSDFAPGGASATLRVIPGAEWEEFGEEGRRRLLEEIYRVDPASDRMGIRLSGPPIGRRRQGELASHGVVPGTVQVPPDGLPIILAADCQPTGGYPKIAHVIGADLPLLAQCAPGDKVAFVLADFEEAWEIWRERERSFRILQAGIRWKVE